MIELAVRQRFGHRGTRIWDLQLDGTLATGQVTALFGPSGAGKTTVLRLLAGLCRPDAGRIVVDGAVWCDTAAGVWVPPQARRVGFVFQDFALFPHMTVRENVAFALPAGGDTNIVDVLLELMVLTPLQRLRPAALSGGQKQRVAVARALAFRPRLLLLDEPFAALETVLRRRLQTDVLEWQRRHACTTLLVSHDAAEVARMADTVWVLEEGRVTARGTPSTCVRT
ncbi:MAG: ATP-binding cassette domain-containing protein [Deltaproteobacteria bacterium]|nr:ATP-binding cassette domain-containing protein [Deltaproteobacteria bacterium]